MYVVGNSLYEFCVNSLVWK